MLYKYCKIDGFDILLQSRLKASRIGDFNDSFELRFSIQNEVVVDSIKKVCRENPGVIKGMMEYLKEQNIGFNKDSSEDIFQKMALLEIEYFDKVKNDVFETKGIISLSKKPDIIQMWAHYAENHKGIVIGIEESEFVKDNAALFEIEYKDEMISLPIPFDPELKEKFNKYISDVIKRKESNWRYEEEVRLYVNFDEKVLDDNYYKIPASSIRELYLGLRSHEMTKMITDSIRQRKEYSHLKIYRMVRSERAYKLEPQKT